MRVKRTGRPCTLHTDPIQTVDTGDVIDVSDELGEQLADATGWTKAPAPRGPKKKNDTPTEGE